MVYNKILVPTDGSEVSLEAAKHAIEMAKAMNSRIYAIYVVDIVPFIGLPTEGLWESMKEILEEEGNDALNKISHMAKDYNVDIKVEILEGNPVKEIVDYAERKKVDLIVMGTIGKTGLDKLLLGSVAEKVTKKSHCPILLVKKYGSEESE